MRRAPRWCCCWLSLLEALDSQLESLLLPLAAAVEVGIRKEAALFPAPYENLVKLEVS